MPCLSTSFMLYSFTTNPAVAILSGTCIYLISPERKFGSAVLDISTMGWYNYTMISLVMPSFQRRNIKRQVKWFDCVLFLEKYRKTSHMIWRCPNHWEISYIRFRLFECVLILEKISKGESDDLTVSSSLKAEFLVLYDYW